MNESTDEIIAQYENIIAELKSNTANLTQQIIDLERQKCNLEHDPLTGLLFRRAIDIETIEENEFIVVLGDIDDFKKINDAHGHEVGDNVLSTIGSVIKSAIRGDDIAVRWGGEEFLIVLKNCDLSHACQRIEKIRVAITNACIKRLQLNVTMSFGLSQYIAGRSSFKSSLNDADKALYISKDNGKNQTSIFVNKEEAKDVPYLQHNSF